MRLTRALGLTLAAGLALPVAGHAAIYDSQASGDWSTTGTWMGMGITTPGPGDTVTIREGNVVTLTADSQADSVTIQPGAELRLAGHNLSLDTTLSINQVGNPVGAVTSASGNPTITLGKSLDLRNATISGANVVVTPGALGGVYFGGHASISGTLTINGPGTVTFRPKVIDATNAMLSVGSLVHSGAITSELDWSFLRPPDTAADPAPGSQVKLLAATGTLNGFTVPGGAEHTIVASATSVMATWGQGTPAQPPANSAKPTISVSDTTMVPGTVLTCEAGTWSESPTYSYSWQRDGKAIVGASSATFTVGFGDIATDLTCTVTATNSAGTAQATSAGRRVEAPPVGLTVTPNPAYVGEKVTVRATAKVGEPASLSPRCFEGVACDPGADHVIPRAAGTTKVGAQVSMKYPGHPATVNVNALPTTLTVRPLPDASNVFAKSAGKAWKTNGTEGALGVYNLPLAAIDGWTPDCETLTPGGKAIDTPVGKVGCTPTSLTLLPTYPTKGENTWRSSLTLRHNGASVSAPIEITVSAQQAPPTTTAVNPLPAPTVGADGKLTCPAGSTPTDVTAPTTKSSFSLNRSDDFTFKRSLGSDRDNVKLSRTSEQSLLKATPTSNPVVTPTGGGTPPASVNVSAQTCAQTDTGAVTTNTVLKVDNTSVIPDIDTTTLKIEFRQPSSANWEEFALGMRAASEVNMEILGLTRGSSAERTGTIAGARRTGAKTPKVPVAIVLYDRVGKGATARMEGIAVYTGMLTKRRNALKLPTRVRRGNKVVAVSRNVRVGVFVLYRKGKVYYPVIGTHLR